METPFNYLSDLTCVHWPEREDAPFELVYNLYSIPKNERVRVKAAAGDDSLESVAGVWPAANWMEREVFDLFGVSFKNHPDLRRLLLPSDWDGHPLRKDYPLEFMENEWTVRHLPEFSEVQREQFEQRRAYGLEIVGAHEKACGVEATGTMQLTVTRLTVRDALHAVHLTKRNRNVLVSNCHLYKNRGVGVFYDHVDLHQSNIVGCHISYNDQGGVVSKGGNVRNIQIGTCDIESNHGKGQPPTANDCTGCHANLSDHATSPPRAQNVTQFDGDRRHHPEFRWLREQHPDPGKLTFNHARHLVRNPGHAALVGNQWQPFQFLGRDRNRRHALNHDLLSH